MDKVKDIFYLIFVKHMFWTLSIVILAMGLFSWWSSTGSLADTYTTNKSKIVGTNDEVSAIANKSTDSVFNPETHAGMREKNDERRREVAHAWQEKYRKQLTEVLVWPKELSADFRRQIEKVLAGRPIEEVNPVNATGGDRLNADLREEYNNKIKSLLPDLAKMINAKWEPSEVARSQGRGGGRGQFGGGEGGGRVPMVDDGEEDNKAYAVTWNSSDQGGIVDLFDWSNEPGGRPTTMQILYSMEDYWVLKAVMQVIKNTNTDEEFGLAELPHQATIRHIDSIQIGKGVSTIEGRVERPIATTPDGEESPEAGPAPTLGGAAEGGVLGEGAALQASDDPVQGRYVAGSAGNYLPISAETLKSATTSEDPEQAYLAVAKRMPVRMKITIDQRKINKFLVECGNADLMLEVKQVRINPDLPDIKSIAGKGSGGGAPAGGNRGGPRGGGEGVGGQPTSENPWDVVVEVYGIIYIFNPPSMKRLTAGLDEEAIAKFQAAISETAPDATPDPTVTPPATTPDPSAETPPAGEAPADEAPPVEEPADEPAEEAAPPAEAKADEPVAPAPAAG